MAALSVSASIESQPKFVIGLQSKARGMSQQTGLLLHVANENHI